MTNPKESQSDVEATTSGRWDRERVRALINECDRDEREGETWTDMIAAALNEHESQLRAELEAVRAERDADAKRLDWLDAQRQKSGIGKESDGEFFSDLLHRYWNIHQTACDVRTAIDAAMQAREGG